jgi:oligoendopeptidase F
LLVNSGDYRYWLEQIRNFKPHTLSEAEEKIVNIKNTTGASALNTLYAAITNRYVFRLEVGGEVKELTRGEVMAYVRESDPDLRKAAYQEQYRVYGQDGPVLGQIYQTLVQDWRNEQVDLRRYSSPIAARNLANDIPDPVVDTLLEVCQRNAALYQRYFRLKARLLGMPRLRRYDIYAPVAKSDKTLSFDRAVELVLDSFSRFEPPLAKLAQRVFADNHLDSEVRKGKRSGAFCETVSPDLTPWVLLNYQGRPDDAATMAHELGHAIHSMLAEGHGLFTQQACLPLAETASTFGEMLFIDHLLAQDNDPSVRRDLLFRQVDDSYATVMRQAFFALFERQAHKMIQEGASVDELSEAYLQNLSTQFGETVEIGDEFRWEWVSIPHIYHTPFYVYAYTFGQLLVLSLYQQYKAEGEAFKPRYLKLLSAGGSEAPLKILAAAGIDVYSAQFWQAGFDVVQRLVEQLETLAVA